MGLNPPPPFVALPWHLQALTEERRRYASLLMGLTNYMNHEILFAQQV